MGVQRKLKRGLKNKKVNLFAGNNRSEKVYNALTQGLCVECASDLIFKGSSFSCSRCHWNGEYCRPEGSEA